MACSRKPFCVRQWQQCKSSSYNGGPFIFEASAEQFIVFIRCIDLFDDGIRRDGVYAAIFGRHLCGDYSSTETTTTAAAAVKTDSSSILVSAQPVPAARSVLLR